MTTRNEPVTILPRALMLETASGPRLATRAAAQGSVYGERLLGDLRIWDPFRSKLASLILSSASATRHLSYLPADCRILYLGAATGTTVSHVSDLFPGGTIYAVEISPRSMHGLLGLAKARSNIMPILADAAIPDSYSRLVEPVDLIYQDLAQRNQADIALRNARIYLKPGGLLVLMIKARCIDSTSPVGEICRSEMGRLTGFSVLDASPLLPYHQDHLAVLARKISDENPR
ncbi:MAG: Fibrillarin-like rRNA/tRNA 2'-O-methyltransferase [Methanosaeta sp. PtaB.Bin039]|nr:MAG: Fibrillarin-like rRNA/tRNA 2'-O-methyltransferase [Methanosaeta sp. PtaB.Bin039]OPY46615.1 MAG: Fibrillarin-like rRNA/tRNA 2'-O-methyltransferase [Methanosaeta sp. PtaU1.Bin028]HOT06103.1 fibrillarin-like rRNA/tRNA 2'-O-methyltransferase [Methanotrichaceae archaeon]HQF16247.1 fibrillarin-like rRNA/tRNA 2'-O-methyltransferase [Methanotrichaceae archaeon]HQI90019.1 fibrillarin-like rRNA/tRNA 2'-O-methyltransferase [Methanotrichaceae archaeon]